MANAAIENKALPENVSPKVKASGVSGTVITIALAVIAAALTAIPGGAFAGLGIWAAPVSAAVTTLAAVLSGYAKADPAREPTIISETVIAEPVQQDPADLVLREDEAVVETTDSVLPGARLVGAPGAGVYVYGDESMGVPVRRVASKDPFEETAEDSTADEVDEFERLNQAAS